MIASSFRIIALVASLAPFFTPAQAKAAQPDIKVRIHPNATAINSGQILLVPVRVQCKPVEGDLLEAFITVEQNVFAEGFFSSITCDGKPQRTLVSAQAFDGVFVKGEASVSALILFCDEQDNCVEGQDHRIVKIRPSKRLP